MTEWFWLVSLTLVVVLTAFHLGVLHEEDREMGIAESLKLSAFHIGIALLFGLWVSPAKGADLSARSSPCRSPATARCEPIARQR